MRGQLQALAGALSRQEMRQGISCKVELVLPDHGPVTVCARVSVRALATKTVMMMGTISCSAPVVSITMTVVVSVMRVAPPMYAAAPTTA